MNRLVINSIAIGFLLTITSANRAWADRGALTIDIGTGATATGLPAPYAQPSKTTQGTSALVWTGLRYALQNSLEISTSVFWEPPVTYFHNQVTVDSFQGTLTHRIHRYGILAGGRFITGKVWRFTVGAEVGWSHRAYSEFKHIDDTNPSAARDYRLNLPDLTRDNWVLAPLVGVEWAIGDHWSLSILPRYEQLLGSDGTFAVTIPVLFSWSWYL